MQRVQEERNTNGKADENVPKRIEKRDRLSPEVLIVSFMAVFLFLISILAFTLPINYALATSVIGLIGAFIGTAFNSILKDRKEQRRKIAEKAEEKEEYENRKAELLEALYSEMAHSYCMLRMVVLQTWNQPSSKKKEPTVPHEAIDLFTCSDIYDYARQDPVTFYKLENAHAIDQFYRTMKQATQWHSYQENAKGIPPKKLEDLFKLVNKLFLDGSLNLNFKKLAQYAGLKDCREQLTGLETKSDRNGEEGANKPAFKESEST